MGLKTKIYNLIILDESGSMSGIKKQTIDGCNETLNTIRSAQTKYGETQEHFISIYAFQSDGQVESRYLINHAPIAKAKNITPDDYEPWGCTPLYDALGKTLIDLKLLVDKADLAIGSVTIITDGMENSSKHFTHAKISEMIKALKEAGWNFNFIGSNIDVQRTSQSLNIDNYMAFEETCEETERMFKKEAKAREAYYRRSHEALAYAPSAARENAIENLKKASKGYFDE